jgi:hypothetical protein
MMHSSGLNLLDSRPVSYLGISNQAHLFTITLVAGAVLVITFYNYLKLFRPIKLFSWAFAVALICQLITAALPYTKNGHFQVPHLSAAFVLAAALVFMPWLFSYSANVTQRARTVSRLITVGYFIVLIPEAILLSLKGYYALGEIVNLVIFDGWLLYLTFNKPGLDLDKAQD